MSIELSFKKYLEYKEQPLDFVGSLKHWFDIDPNDISSPKFFSNLKLGNISYNGTLFQIVDMKYDEKGELSRIALKPVNDTIEKFKHAYVGLKNGKEVEVPQHDDSVVWINRDQFSSLISSTASPAPMENMTSTADVANYVSNIFTFRKKKRKNKVNVL